jgi:hypothetical protein
VKKLLILLALTGCNNKAEVPNRMDIVQSGKSTTEVTISFEFLNQLTSLCRGLVGNTPYPTLEAREAAVSECVFGHLKDIGAPINATGNYANEYCGANPNYAGLTPDQIAQVQATCKALGY